MGILHKLDEVLTEYGRARDPWHNYVVPTLTLVPLWWLIEQTGLDRRTIQRLRNRQSEPRPATEERLTEAAGKWARDRLREAAIRPRRDDALACREWLEYGGDLPDQSRRPASD